jgi:AraC-like DNA-binding protein
MTDLQSSLYVIAITSCVFYLFVARRNGTGEPGQTYRYLIAYLLLESGSFVLEWLMVQPGAPGKSLWLGLLMASSFLMAPCVWLFAREITEGAAPPLRSIPTGHVAVIAIGMALTLPLIQRSYWGPLYGDPTDPTGPVHRLVIQVSMALCALLFLVQVPYYLRACWRILASHAGQAKAMHSNIEPQPLNALRLLIVVAFANWLVSLFRVMHCILLGADTGLGVVFALLETGATVGIVFMLARRTTTFSIEDRELVRELLEPEEDNTATKYARSRLDEVMRARIRRKLDQAFANAVHRDNRLSLRGLCQHIRENPHYVSQVINQDLATSFYDLVNRQRIESAKSALTADPAKTVLEVALEAGFNSKSTFNTAFRQHAGSTPTQFRREHKTPKDEVRQP